MNKKILVCEDDQSLGEVIKIILEEDGYEVLLINSGKGIIKKIDYFTPKMILLDILMPGIGGKEITKMLKKDPLAQKIPIILISAVSNLKELTREIGADDFITKPFDMDNLLKITHKYA